jgi:predicted Fe-Mo cluster-binding NifX family protein
MIIAASGGADKMIVCIPVTPDGQVGHGWGRAERVAVARVADGAVTDWRELDVRWNEMHDQGTPGAHHARVVRFLREQGVEAVVAGHMGDGMRTTLAKLGVRVRLGASGDARSAAAATAAADEGPAAG